MVRRGMTLTCTTILFLLHAAQGFVTPPVSFRLDVLPFPRLHCAFLRKGASRIGSSGTSWIRMKRHQLHANADDRDTEGPTGVRQSLADAMNQPPPLAVTLDTKTLSTDDSVNLADVQYSYKDAVQRTLGWVGAAVLFGCGVWLYLGGSSGEEFFAGYLVEQSLSVDNLFVFLLLFEYFKVPLPYQDRILNWGIYGAIIMRGIMIGAGAVALQQFHAILLVFAAILVYSSASFFLGNGDKAEEDEDPGKNAIVQFATKLFPSVDHYDGNKFFTVVDGITRATPLFICMIAVEISDVVFAVDSIPAVFGVTEVSTTLDESGSEKLRFPHISFLCIDVCPSLVQEPVDCFYVEYVRNHGTPKHVHHSIKGGDGFAIFGTCGGVGPGLYW
jgi:TerC family integral membrane protein